MIIHAKIKPGSKKGPLVLEREENNKRFFEVFVREPAVEGKATKAAGELLAKHFSLPKTNVRLKTGQTSRFKTFEITEKS